jgi:Phytochelatin synthase
VLVLQPGRSRWIVRRVVCTLAAAGWTLGACQPRVTTSVRSPPKYGPLAVPLSRSHEYFRRAGASDFWSLAPYYVPQQDDRSCSLASLSMLVNAARRGQSLDSEQPLVTQPLLLQRVRSEVWARGLAPGGEGVTLDQLAVLAEQSLHAFGFRARAEVTHVVDRSAHALAQLRVRLAQNEAGGDDWLLINFDPGPYTGVGGYGHIAPVGAYDAALGRVLILDPDRTWYEPYWVADAVVLAGMATLDRVARQPRGYVFVSIDSP